ncbi:amino acid permease [Phenylobacterium sp.]|uniref:APC family permease n=1 Tax=Phenylobacterium sp. TaxID=1871053 RepID=UPI0028125F1F|nr:amino acid permease [Phenylobacterium sp.]
MGTVDGGGGVRATLRAREAVAITVGIVVGAGIFRTPSLVAGAADSAGAVLLAWAAGGLVSLVGALCYAELASTYPHAGGDYHYLARAFGRRLAFLYGWARLAVIQTGSVALLAFVFGDYMSELAPLGPFSSALYAAGAVVGITAIQWIGVRAGAGAQMWLTLAEVAGLVAVIVAGLLVAPAAGPSPPPAETSALGLMMVFVLLTFGGWNEAAYVSAELKDARRRMAPVLLGSLALITLLYLLANAAYLRALGLGGVAKSDAVAAELMRIAFGAPGAVAVSAIVAVAALTSANATVFTGARTAWALGRDNPQLAALGHWHPDAATPRNGLLLQGAAALALVAIGAFARDGFRLAVEYTAPVFWGFFLLVGVALFRLRRIDPAADRPFKVPLYPLLPALFVATNAYLLYSSLAYTGRGALLGLAVLAVGGLLLIPLRTRKEDSP